MLVTGQVHAAQTLAPRPVRGVLPILPKVASLLEPMVTSVHCQGDIYLSR